MRTLLLFLIAFCLNSGPSCAWAEDLFLARVLSVDRDAGRVSVVLIENEWNTPDAGDHSESRFEVTIHPNRLPRYLMPGNVVRIWGDMADERQALNATRLWATGQGTRGNDPTGVRRRIGKSRSPHAGKGGGRGHGRR